MPKLSTHADLVLESPSASGPRWRWLYVELRTAILESRLKAGARLPSTRELARQYGVSRGTAVAAFDQLLAEGFIQTQVGAGSFVAFHPPADAPLLPAAQPSRATIAARAERDLAAISALPPSRRIGPAFRTYEPAIDAFPVDLWSRVNSRVLRHAPRALYGQGDPAGYLPLRRAIAEYLGRSRGVRCTADQIVVTSGAQQALDLLARLLLDPGDQAWIEDPCYPGARAALAASGARLVPIPVDPDGVRVDRARRLAPRARLAYVTPANQFPLGYTMSAARRVELLDWAARAGAWIVEDEYDAEYRYSGRPVASLHSLDRSGCVIYVGTFTKMLFNSLRLGYLVLPERIAAACAALRTITDRHPSTLQQAALAEFIDDGHFGRHVHNMRQLYAERLAALRRAAAPHSPRLAVADAPSGMRTIGWLENGQSDADVAARARAAGLEVIPVSAFTLRHPQPPGLILGFAGCTPSELRRGVNVLAPLLA